MKLKKCTLVRVDLRKILITLMKIRMVKLAKNLYIKWI